MTGPELLRAIPGVTDFTVLNPGAKHSLGVGILTRCRLTFDGSLGCFGLGLIEGLTRVFYPAGSAVVIFVIMAIVLMLKPEGLFGRPS